MAADAPAHAFAGERDRPVMLGAKRGKRRSMRFDKLGQRVRPPSARQGIRVIKRLDGTDRRQEPCEGPHSRVRGGGAGARREKKGGTGHERQFIGSGGPRQPALICSQGPRRGEALVSSEARCDRFQSLSFGRGRCPRLTKDASQ